MKTKLMIVLVSITIGMMGAPSAHAAAILTVPGSAVVGYATSTAVADPAAPLTYLNLDLDTHNVVSKTIGPDSNPWCAKYSYTKGHCPLFRSDDLATGQYGDVAGISATKSGVDYPFYCSYHAGTMTGTLKVQ